MISVDCKKKELIGNFKNNGREWQAKGQDTTVNVYDYRSIADGKAVPYGIYDLVHNRASSMWGLTMRPPSLPWRVSDAGGGALEAPSIQPVRSS